MEDSKFVTCLDVDNLRRISNKSGRSCLHMFKHVLM